MAGTSTEQKLAIHIAGKVDSSLNSAVSTAQKALSSLGTAAAKIAKVTAAAVGAATTAAVAFAKQAVDTGMEFDASMSQVAATMGYSVDELNDKNSEASKSFETLRNFAMDMGAKTAFSATQAAEALNYMALAGYDVEKSTTMLPNVLNLAAAGGIDLASASDMVTDAQSALGLSMEETAALVDKMAQTSSKANTSVAQMGEAILTIGGTAKNLAGGTTELSTALGILADNGVKGAEGGTALRNIVLSLSAPTDTAAKAMSNLGLQAFDSAGNLRPLNETFGDLNEALSHLTQEERTQALNAIFNKVDLKSVNALLANSGERYDELTEYINNVQGAAENMANTQLDNLQGDITLWKSALEGAQIVLSDQLTPTLREFVQFGTQSLGELTDAFKENGLTGAMEALGKILSNAINMVVAKLPTMVDAGMQLLGALGQGLIDNLPVIVDAAFEIATMLANGVLSALPQVAKAGIEIIISLADGITKNLPELAETAVEAVRSFADGITQNLPELVTATGKAVSTVAMTISKALPEIISAAANIIAEIAIALTDPATLTAILEADRKSVV